MTRIRSHFRWKWQNRVFFLLQSIWRGETHKPWHVISSVVTEILLLRVCLTPVSSPFVICIFLRRLLNQLRVWKYFLEADSIQTDLPACRDGDHTNIYHCCFRLSFIPPWWVEYHFKRNFTATKDSSHFFRPCHDNMDPQGLDWWHFYLHRQIILPLLH